MSIAPPIVRAFILARQLYNRALSSEDRHRADADVPANGKPLRHRSLSEPARQPPDKYYSQAKLWREAPATNQISPVHLKHDKSSFSSWIHRAANSPRISTPFCRWSALTSRAVLEVAMTDRADGFLPREEIPDRRSSSTLVALGKNARMMRPARVSCGPSAANGLPLVPSASARTDCASSWHGSSSCDSPRTDRTRFPT